MPDIKSTSSAATGRACFFREIGKMDEMNTEKFNGCLAQISAGRADSNELLEAMAYAATALYESRQILRSICEGYTVLLAQAERERSKRAAANTMLAAALRENKRLRAQRTDGDEHGLDCSG